ncbi:MAG TPA: SGNH/GDSL hydrolase family protein [Candidatus Saccharimonadales bacterium]|nr:SGNH/GDSL hydrolase family protein [Candidatus Saccharimonadales bacterium]
MELPKGLGGRLLLLVAACGAALAAGEILVRATGAAPQVAYLHKGQFRLSSNVLIGWEPIPNPDSKGSTLHPQWSEEQRNSLGYRDYEHTLQKVPGVYRIEVIGDSVTKGLGTQEHEGTFPSVIERKLRESGTPNEVLNFGVEGYNTQQEVETLRDRGLRYDPDLVILAYLPNDRDWPAHHLYVELLQEERGSGSIDRTRLSPLLGRSALYRFLRFRVLGPLFLSTAESDTEIQRLVNLVQTDTVEKYFGVLAQLQKKAGFQVLVVVFPYLDNLAHYSHAADHAWVRALSARYGFHHLDLLDAFARCEEKSDKPIAIDNVHPNFIGNYCAGVTIAEYIRSEILPQR